MAFWKKIGQLISTLPEAAARVTGVGLKVIGSFIPGVGNITSNLTGNVTGSTDPVTNQVNTLLAQLLAPPNQISNQIINTSIIGWLRKNWVFIVGLIVAVYFLLRKKKRKR